MKKLLALLLAVAMLVSCFAACGKEDAGTTNNETTVTPIKLGGIGPTTGGAAIYGQAVKNANSR